MDPGAVRLSTPTAYRVPVQRLVKTRRRSSDDILVKWKACIRQIDLDEVHPHIKTRSIARISSPTDSKFPPNIAGFYFSAESHTPFGKTQVGFLRALLHQILHQLPEESRTKVLRAKHDTQDWTMGASIVPNRAQSAGH